MVLLRRFLEVSLDDGEVLRVVDRLHHEPGKSLLVLGVDGGSLEELGVELGDGLLVGLGAHVWRRSALAMTSLLWLWPYGICRKGRKIPLGIKVWMRRNEMG